MLDKILNYKNRYRIYLLAHAFVIVAVITFFRMIPDIKIAALAAGVLFLIGPICIIFTEFKAGTWLKSFSSYGALIFFGLSSLPIFSLRVFNWNEKFENLSLMGISGPDLHQMSNYLFNIMLASFLIDSIMTAIKARRNSEAL